MGERATLSPRQLARWMKGDVGQPRPVTQRVAEDFWGYPFEVLLGPADAMQARDRIGDDLAPAYVANGVGAQLQLALSAIDSVLSGDVAVQGGPDLPERAGGRILSAPAGRFFDGLTIETQAHPAIDDGRILAAVPAGYVNDDFLRRPRRGLVIGVTDRQDRRTVFGVDTRQARRTLARSSTNASLVLPRAYALDEVTFGILWAVANLDEALIHDDALLADLQDHLAGYETLPQSAAGRELAADLTAVSQMWVGSDFCARHILRHLDDLGGAPEFWTREQRGEEASTWLLFRHKYEYLQVIMERFGDTPLSRSFCIPPDAVAASPPGERVLLMLAATLMESFKISIAVYTDPEYSAVPGFVLDSGRRVIVANWVGADGIWRVGVSTSRATVREYGDITGYTRSHSAVAGATPAQRLHRLADYLSLDWLTLTRRCAELGEYGTAGIAEPRSRLLSTMGLDRACRYLGQLSAPGR